ncbi:MAG: LD-carboxypeptidase [Ignavibacterium sp.]
MRRKKFIQSISTLTLFSLFSKNSFGNQKINSSIPIIKPKHLKAGDKIGLISPGGFITENELKESISNIENLGYEVVPGKNVLEKFGYFAGTDEQRASDLNEMFLNEKVNGIVCTRGGYGCSRILPLLNYDAIRNNPKILIGYSDVTALFYGIFSQTGLITFHGPVATSTFNDFSVNNFKNVLMSKQKNLTLYNPIETINNNLNSENNNLNSENKNSNQIKIIRSGKAEGILIGGNLSIVVSMIGTRYDIDYTDKIIFLEEVGEEPYRIDRMLTQMIQSKKFDKAAGIALGVFSKCEAKPNQSGITNSFSLIEVLGERLYPLGIPVIYGMSFGHIINKFTLPFGINTKLDVDNQTLTLLESVVI